MMGVSAGFVNVGQAIPTGVICMWSGLVAPSGWNLCDGTNGTPDLRNQFIMGWDGAAVGATGGSDAHSHAFTQGQQTDAGYASVSDSGHTHAASKYDLGGGGSDIVSVSDVGYASVTDSGHSHALTNLNTDTSYHLPPYYTLAFIMKL